MNIQCYNLYHIYNILPLLIRHNAFGLLRYTVHEDTLFKITKCFAHNISYLICMCNNSSKALCAQILQSKLKNLISSVKL